MLKQPTPKSHHAAIVRYAIAEVASLAEAYRVHRRNAIVGTKTEAEETKQHKDDLRKLASALDRQAYFIREMVKD